MKNILAVGAHPDDVELGCGGTLIKHIKNGNTVTIMHMTNTGVKNVITGEVLRTAEQSKSEAEQAAEIMGANIVQLCFEDQNVPFNLDSIVAIEKYIINLNIDTIFTHWGGDSHQDHINTLKSTLAAGRNVDNIFLYEQVPMPRVGNIFPNINFYFDISDCYELKMKACSAHKSQITEKYKNKVLEGTRALAEYRGAQADCKYAEAFECIKFIKR